MNTNTCKMPRALMIKTLRMSAPKLREENILDRVEKHYAHVHKHDGIPKRVLREFRRGLLRHQPHAYDKILNLQ